MTTDATAPRATAARRPPLNHQLHVLVDEQVKEFVLGLAVEEARLGGFATLREAAGIRDLLDEAIAARYAADRKLYNRTVIAGRAALAARAAEDATKR